MTEQAAELQTWLRDNNAHDSIAYWIPKYIMLRNVRWLSSYDHLMSDKMKVVAPDLDRIGWRNFMEGKVAKSVFALQAKALQGVHGAPGIRTWSKQFIDRVLHISYSQWIF